MKGDGDENKKFYNSSIVYDTYVFDGRLWEKNITKECYGTFSYVQEDGSKETIHIEEKSLKLSINLEDIQNAKAGLELGKKKKEMEQENQTMTEEEASDYLEECKEKIDLSSFDNANVAYTTEYDEDTQQIYITTEEKNNQSISLNYDLKYQILTLYSKEFSKEE